MDILWYQQRLIVIYHDLSTKQASSQENLLMKKKLATLVASRYIRQCYGIPYLVFMTMKRILDK